MSPIEEKLALQEGQILALTEILQRMVRMYRISNADWKIIRSSLQGPQFDAVQESFGLVSDEETTRRKGFDQTVQTIFDAVPLGKNSD